MMSENWSHPAYSISPNKEDYDINGTIGSEVGYSLAEKIVIGSLLAFLIFLSIVGNLLVCIAVFTDRRLKKNSNFFIVSLAIADLLVAGLVMSFAIANDIQGRWQFGRVFCRIWISSDVMCSTASILNLCVISLDRYIHIRDPLRYEAWMTGRKTIAFIATVWILSLVISFIPIHLGWHTKNNISNAEEDMCIFELNPVYAIVSSTISFYIPCVVMLSIYCRLYLYAKRHVEVIKRTHTAERFHVSSNGSTKSSYKVSDHKAAVTLGIIMGVFMFCWVPFFIINPLAAFCDTCIPGLVFKILTWLGYVNSCLNPIIYSIFNQEFRDAFRRILLPKFCLEDTHKNMWGASSSRVKVNKSEYSSSLMENGSTAVRKNSKERLFSEKVTSL